MELLPLAYIFIGFFILIFIIDKVMFDYHNKPKERKPKFKTGDRVAVYGPSVFGLVNNPVRKTGVIKNRNSETNTFGVYLDNQIEYIGVIYTFNQKQLRKLKKKVK